MTPEELRQQQIEKIKTSKYAHKVPQLTPQQAENLKQSLKRWGFLPNHPIIINNQAGDILDGHHRYWFCQELGIKPVYAIHEPPFKSQEEEELYVYEINRARRQLNKFQDVELVLKEKPLLAKLAKQNMKRGKKSLSRGQERLHVDKELAKKAGVSKDFLYSVEQVIKAGEESPDKRLEFDYDGRYRGHQGPTYAQLLADAREGKRLTPTEAHKALKRDLTIKAKRADAAIAAKAHPLPEKVLLLNADSTKPEEIAHDIADNSVDLIITDPPYMKQHLDVFDALARLALRKLKQGGSLVFYYSTFFEPQIHQILAKYEEEEDKKLTWYHRFVVDHQAGETQIHARHVRVKCKHMMWFVKGGNRRLTGTWVSDYIKSTKPDKDKHPWAQSSTEAEYLIKYLTISEDSLVVDPFLGSGAFAIPAIKLGRYFIGIEKDKQTFENAQNYIKNETATAKENSSE